MEIVYTDHALIRMKEREIKEEQIREAILKIQIKLILERKKEK